MNRRDILKAVVAVPAAGSIFPSTSKAEGGSDFRQEFDRLLEPLRSFLPTKYTPVV